MRPRQIDVHVARIDLSAMPAGGERRLREAVERELARLAGAAHHDGRWQAGPSPRGERRPHEGSGGGGAEIVADRIARQVDAGLSGERKS